MIWEAFAFSRRTTSTTLRSSVSDVLTMVQASHAFRGKHRLLQSGRDRGRPCFRAPLSPSLRSLSWPEGIGDTIRFSVGSSRRGSQGRQRMLDPGPADRTLEIVSCPPCGRAQVDVWTLARTSLKCPKELTVCCAWPPWASRQWPCACEALQNAVGQRQGRFSSAAVVETNPPGPDRETLIRRANALAEMGLEPVWHRRGESDIAPEGKLPGSGC